MSMDVNNTNVQKKTDVDWLCRPMLFTYSSLHRNELNIKLNGCVKLIDDAF